jgi:hypothetical protein
MRPPARCLTAIPLLTVGCIEYTPPGPERTSEVVFNQFDPPVETVEDTYIQVQKPEVDVLWVIDNSCSMESEQEEVAADFPLFMQYFLGSGLDYHIGVVSTDMDDPDQSGRLTLGPAQVRWIDEATPDPMGAFAAMAQLGIDGSSVEQGIAAGYAAFELQRTFNDGFLREDSAVHVIVLSDESDFSAEDPVTLGEYTNYLNGLRADPAMVQYHAIVSPPAAAPDTCQGVQTAGDRYIQVSQAVGGVYRSLCDTPWSAALEAIGLESAGLRREYFLTERPVDGTIRVAVDDQGNTLLFDAFDPETALGDWVYSDPRNSITFLSYVPEAGAVVHITYDALSSAER